MEASCTPETTTPDTNRSLKLDNRRRKPGPKPRPRPTQLEAFDLSEMRGRPPNWWTCVDRLAAKGEKEMAHARDVLGGVGWALVANAELWVAHSRNRNRTARACTAAGLIRAVLEAENGVSSEQTQFDYGPGAQGVNTCAVPSQH